MQTVEIRIGGKNKDAVKVPARLADTVEDAIELADGDTKAFVRCFNRGLRIEYQERSGARDALKEGKSIEEVAKMVAEYKPSQVAARRTGVKKPAVVNLPAGKKSFTPEDLAALLASQGITLQIGEAAQPAAAASA